MMYRGGNCKHREVCCDCIKTPADPQAGRVLPGGARMGAGGYRQTTWATGAAGRRGESLYL